MPFSSSRRRFLAGGVAGAAGLMLPAAAWGLGAASQFRIAELHLAAGSLSRPEAWKRLVYEVIQSTSVSCDPAPVVIEPEAPELFAHPFCVLVGNGALPTLSDAAAENLVRFLSYGGFLLIDDASGVPGGPFARSVDALARRLFPTRPLSPLPGDHSVFRSFFLLDRPVGRVDLVPSLSGVTVGPTSPLVFCGNDLSGALDRGPDGRDRFPVVPGGEAQRRQALKLGVNLVMYALTSNYKHDIAHVAELIREGRMR